MELKELYEKICEIFKVDSCDQLSKVLLEVCLSNEDTKIEQFVNTVEDLQVDWLQKIYQYYMADRKRKKQDYTPQSIGKLVAELTNESDELIDLCAGTGALTIQQWSRNKNIKACLYEVDEKVIPFLVFNMCARNISAQIHHADVLKNETYHIYVVKPQEKYAHAQEIKDEFDIKSAI